MKSLSKFAVIFPFICLLALAAVIISTAFPSAGTALADDAAFDIVYPEKGYFPIEDATLVAASDSHIAVFDAAARSVFTLTVDRTKAEAFPLTAGEWELTVCSQYNHACRLYKEPRYGTLAFSVY